MLKYHTSDLKEGQRDSLLFHCYVLDKLGMAYRLRIVFVEAALYCHDKSLNSEIDKGSNCINGLYQFILQF